jgi:hypothetical protein
LLLGRVGHEAALEQCRELARVLLGRDYVGERARRLDMCADFDGFELEGVKREAWIAGRARIAEHAYAATFARGPQLTGFTIGKGESLLVRVYDKTEELRLDANAGAKRQEQQARWEAAGWLGDPVVRVEAQLRGDLLDQLDMRDPEVLFENLPGVWTYVMEKWCRLSVPGTATRRERWRLDARWRSVQAVPWGEVQAVKRLYIRADPNTARLASLGLSVFAAADEEAVEGTIDLCGGSPKRVLEWQPATAERMVRDLLTGDGMREACEQAVAQWVEDLITTRGGPAALCYVLERFRVTSARRANLGPLLAERAAIRVERAQRRQKAAA